MSSAQDQKFCQRMLPAVSRTFALSIEALPPGLRDAVRTAYLLCRVVDSVEDATGLQQPAREQLFDHFDRTMSDDTVDPREAFEAPWSAAGGQVIEDEDRLCRDAGAVFRVFRALPREQRDVIRPRVLEMSGGMREYTARAAAAGQLRLSDLDDLERYCYFVAGTVGRLLTGLFLQQVPVSPELRQAIEAHAVRFGLGLQLVNIVKDVAEDHPRGACFLPQSVARQHGVDLDRVLEPSQRTRALALMRAVCARARQHLAAAETYTALWPMPAGEPVRLFCLVPLAFAVATLVEVERGHDTLRPGATPKISRLTVARLLVESRGAAQDNRALHRLLARCRGEAAPVTERAAAAEPQAAVASRLS